MRPPLARPLASLAIGFCLVAPACGGDDPEPERFSSGYNAAIERLDRASREVIEVAPARQSRSGRAIARQLESFAEVLAGTRGELAQLTPPKQATKEFDQLIEALDDSVAAGQRAAAAARAIQPARQRRALRQLQDSASEVARAQVALGRAVEGASG